MNTHALAHALACSVDAMILTIGLIAWCFCADPLRCEPKRQRRLVHIVVTSSILGIGLLAFILAGGV